MYQPVYQSQSVPHHHVRCKVRLQDMQARLCVTRILLCGTLHPGWYQPFQEGYEYCKKIFLTLYTGTIEKNKGEIEPTQKNHIAIIQVH